MGSGNFKTSCVQRDISMNPNSTDNTVMRLVGREKRVLEIGCGAGHMSNALKGQACEVVGIEIDPEAAKRASAFCENVIVADLDYMNFEEGLGDDRFDVVVAADVLEHLKDPVTVLQNLREFLLPGGYLVVSVPNIAHASVRLALLAGRFPYGESGLLDRTHLRFFTRDTAEQLLEAGGFVVGHLERISNIPPDPATFEVPYNPNEIPPEILESICRDPEAWAYQFVMVGHPAPQPDLVFIQERVKQLSNDAEQARREADNLRRQLGETKVQFERALLSLSERSALAEAGKLEMESRVNSLLHEVSLLQDAAARLRESNSKSEKHIQSLQDDEALLKKRIEELSGIRASDVRNAAELRADVEQQKQRNIGLAAQLDALLVRERDLREMLLEANDQLLRRDEEIAAALPYNLLHAPQPVSALGPYAPQTLPGKYLQYQQLLQKIRESVRDSGVKSSNVLVISKGDEELLKFDGCSGSHFPQDSAGKYAGYHPENGEAAIRHLETLRDNGARFLLIPQTSLWWLDHYAEFRDYLNRHFSRLVDNPEVCVLFNLAEGKIEPVHSEEVDANDNIHRVRLPFGVNVSGNITSEKGVGEAVRSQIRSLAAVDTPIALNNYTDDSAANLDVEYTEFSEGNPFAVNLIHLNADSLKYFVEGRPQSYFNDRYNIGFWAWETPVFPKEWQDRFQFLNEIWVGSDFVMNAISDASPIPVVKMPLAIRDRMSENALPRSHFGIPKSAFTFLFLFDFLSVPQRKNPFGMVKAFRNAFGKRDDVLLVLKCSHSEHHPKEMSELKRDCRGANIRIIDALLSRKEVTSLLKTADCYVSLHRSEGFGLTMAEAMSFEKPVIATGFSGNMEFMNSANSHPVKYKLTEIDRDYGPYRGGFWAEPDLDHAAELMRHVFKDRAAARELGRNARRDILKTLSEERTGIRMRDRLNTLAELGKIAAPEVQFKAEVQPEKGMNGSYHHLVDRIREIVESAVPRDSCVLVVSKGDDNLTEFKARSALHFPQSPDGRYAGHHPADSNGAIQQLETLRIEGGQFLLFPQTSFWWLDYYKELQSHLRTNYRKVWDDSDCIIYRLSSKKTNGRSRKRAPRSRTS
jgi:2-polyprenyl-3-methyl-5-hydroxy-6-metoxy-1,4-benzoquinol methylase/glycosyltransferase involved in cell wall biosynthesis